MQRRTANFGHGNRYRRFAAKPVPYGGKWVGTDISAEQIAQAKRLSVGLDIDYEAVAAENINFPAESFDVITACQCFWYFDHSKIMPNLYRMLKPHGKLLILYMACSLMKMRLRAGAKSWC